MVYSNGNSHPSIENKYYSYYKSFLVKKIIDNNIDEIITININNDMYINYLLSDNCYIRKNVITETLISHLIKNVLLLIEMITKKQIF